MLAITDQERNELIASVRKQLAQNSNIPPPAPKSSPYIHSTKVEKKQSINTSISPNETSIAGIDPRVIAHVQNYQIQERKRGNRKQNR